MANIKIKDLPLYQGEISGNIKVPASVGNGEACAVNIEQITDYVEEGIEVPTKTSELTNDSGFLTQHQDISGKANVSDLNAHTGNTNVHVTASEKAEWDAKTTMSDVEAKGYLTEHQSLKTINGQTIVGDGNIEIGEGGTQVQADWAEEDETSMAYINNKPDIPTKTSELTNDSGFLTEHQSLEDYYTSSEVDTQLESKADAGSVPTKVSELENDSGYSTFSGSYNDLTNKPDIPTKTSELENDSNFLTEHQQLKTINNQSIVGEGNITIEGGSEKVIFNWGNGITTEEKQDLYDHPEKYILRVYKDNYYWLCTQYYKGSSSVSFYYLTSSINGSYKYVFQLNSDLVMNPFGNVYIYEYAPRTSVVTKTSQLTNDSGFLTEHQSLKTINGQTIVGDGNIEIGEGGTQVQSDWAEEDETSMAYIQNKPNIPTNTSELNNDSGFIDSSVLEDYYTAGEVDIALASKADAGSVPTKVSDLENDSGYSTFSGSYNDLTNKPTIPAAANNGTLTIKVGAEEFTFGADSSEDVSVSIAQSQADWNDTDTTSASYIKNKPTVPVNTSELNNDSGFIDSSALDDYYTAGEVTDLLSGKADESSIPTKVSDLENDEGFTTFDGDFENLTNKPETEVWTFTLEDGTEITKEIYLK